MKGIGKYLLIGIGIAVVLVILWFFKNIVAYLLIAVVFSLIGRPIVDFLNRLRIKKFYFPKALSAAIALVVIWALFVTFFLVFVPLIINQAEELSTIDGKAIMVSLEGPIMKLEGLLRRFNMGLEAGTSFEQFITTKLGSLLNVSLLSGILGTVANILGNIFVALFSITFITFFFLKDERLFVNGIILLVPTKHEEGAHHALSSIKHLLMRYFIGILLQITGIIILVTIGLSIVGLGFDKALIIGLIVGLFNVIPYLGPYIGAFLGLVLGIANNLDLEFYTQLLPMLGYMFLVFVIVQVVDNVVFQPLIYGTSVMAHPLEIFLVILIGGYLAGIAGMILAIPTYTVLRVIGKEFFNRYKVIKKLTERID